MLIYDLDLPALTDLLRTWDEPAYRAKQIWQGLYVHLYDSPAQFTNLPLTLRQKLAENAVFTPFTVKTWLKIVLPLWEAMAAIINATTAKTRQITPM